MFNKAKMAKFSGHIYNNASFAKSNYVGKIIYGVCPFSQTSGLSQVWLVWEEKWLEYRQFESAYAILDPPVRYIRVKHRYNTRTEERR